MEQSQSYIGAPNGVVLCVDQVGVSRLDGRFYHHFSREPVAVTNLAQLVFELEGLFDELNYPYPTTRERSFQEEERRHPNQRRERVKVMSDKELLSKHGDLGTFIIRVQHRQNSSWQGRITWTETNKTLNFRSVWEMIRLIASALHTVGGPEEELDEPSWTED